MSEEKTLGQSRTTVVYKDDEAQKSQIQHGRDMVASMINYANVFSKSTEDPEAKRLFSLSMTAFEE